MIRDCLFLDNKTGLGFRSFLANLGFQIHVLVHVFP